jgi:hypothetical protein
LNVKKSGAEGKHTASAPQPDFGSARETKAEPESTMAEKGNGTVN